MRRTRNVPPWEVLRWRGRKEEKNFGLFCRFTAGPINPLSTRATLWNDRRMRILLLVSAFAALVLTGCQPKQNHFPPANQVHHFSLR
jgi:hypothetical protein